ncbi:NAD(P)H-dependent oxidoreductase [Clostridiaceae bacterium M8S5]|nr:NAD(P)H-dependent oxidoreductase [Clostridiaceae bacterium M8S5]
MKVLVLLGSLRKGNTYKLTKLVQDNMNEQGDVEFEEIFLGDIDLGYCISCHNCILKGEEFCPHRETTDMLEQKMLNADAIIISAPVYMLSVPGVVKNLVDHFAYILHRPVLFDKNVLVVVSTAGGGDKKVAKYLKDVFEYWGANKVFIFRHKVFAIKLEITDKLAQKAKRISKMFYNSIESKKLKEPSVRRIAFYNAFRAITFLDTTEDTADYKYYKKLDWFDKVYPVDTVKNPFKKAIGNITFHILKKIVPKSNKQ